MNNEEKEQIDRQISEERKMLLELSDIDLVNLLRKVIKEIESRWDMYCEAKYSADKAMLDLPLRAEKIAREILGDKVYEDSREKSKKGLNLSGFLRRFGWK